MNSNFNGTILFSSIKLEIMINGSVVDMVKTGPQKVKGDDVNTVVGYLLVGVDAVLHPFLIGVLLNAACSGILVPLILSLSFYC